MDRRDLKNFITKRSSIWTLSLCMTGIIVLGGIAAIDNTRRSGEEQTEIETGDMAYLDDDGSQELFDTLGDGNGNMADEGPAINADGTSEDGSSADGSTAGVAVNADGSAAGMAVNADGSAVNGDGSIANTDGSTVNADGNIANADGNIANANGSMVNADGSMANADGSSADAGPGTEEAAEASSTGLVSEQALIDAGVSFTEEQSLLWPSAGTILIDYSMDSSVYFPTLDQYKYNPALIIGSETGNQVLASAKGIVESVGIDEETGMTLVLNIGNGYRLTYGQLKELAVSQGDVVESGTVLGYVSEPTKYYSEEGSNLYFKMTQNGQAVDPVLYLE